MNTGAQPLFEARQTCCLHCSPSHSNPPSSTQCWLHLFDFCPLCAFKVSSKCLYKRMQSHIGCICLTFLHYMFPKKFRQTCCLHCSPGHSYPSSSPSATEKMEIWKDLTFKFEEFLDVVIPVRLKKGKREMANVCFYHFPFTQKICILVNFV